MIRSDQPAGLDRISAMDRYRALVQVGCSRQSSDADPTVPTVAIHEGNVGEQNQPRGGWQIMRTQYRAHPREYVRAALCHRSLDVDLGPLSYISPQLFSGNESAPAVFMRCYQPIANALV